MFIYSGCSITLCKVDIKSDAICSSINLRSNERVDFIIVCVAFPFIFGTSSDVPLPTARIAHCGGFIIAVNSFIPNIPRLEIVNVPPY